MKKNFKVIITVALLILTGCCAIYVYTSSHNDNESTSKEGTPSNVITLGEIYPTAELTTSTQTMQDEVEYKEGEIPYLTQKSFTIRYCAEYKAGIKDAHLIKIAKTDDMVKVDLPEIEIIDIGVIEESVEFIDEKKALFNWEDKDDATNAIILAEENAKEKVSLTKELRKEAQIEFESQIEEWLIKCDYLDGREIIFI